MENVKKKKKTISMNSTLGFVIELLWMQMKFNEAIEAIE